MTERLETATTSGTAIQWSLAKGPCADGHAEEKTFIAELRVGNEQAFEVLLDRLSGPMLRFARSILSDRETAEEVVQDTWLAAIRGLDRFEGRSSLKTWIFSILANVARTRVKRERRTVAFSSISEIESPIDKLAAEAERFSEDRHAWMSPPRRQKQTPEDHLLSTEAVTRIDAALQSMPPRQAEVVTLRDIEGWSAKEVCQTLGLTASNQKVLLHRGRARIRTALAEYLARDERPSKAILVSSLSHGQEAPKPTLRSTFSRKVVSTRHLPFPILQS